MLAKAGLRKARLLQERDAAFLDLPVDVPSCQLLPHVNNKANVDTGRNNPGVGGSVPMARSLLVGGAKIVLRCTLVEGLNDTDEHLRAIAETWKRHPELLGVEIIAVP
jgi:hypothetical protein